MKKGKRPGCEMEQPTRGLGWMAPPCGWLAGWLGGWLAGVIVIAVVTVVGTWPGGADTGTERGSEPPLTSSCLHVATSSRRHVVTRVLNTPADRLAVDPRRRRPTSPHSFFFPSSSVHVRVFVVVVIHPRSGVL